eukprot:11111260-Alexandrium_andersonii.AAC.1
MLQVSPCSSKGSVSRPGGVRGDSTSRGESNHDTAAPGCGDSCSAERGFPSLLRKESDTEPLCDADSEGEGGNDCTNGA